MMLIITFEAIRLNINILLIKNINNREGAAI